MRLYFFSVFVIIVHIFYGQTYTISGYITDESNGENIFGANIILDSLKLGTTSNSFGFYSLTLPAGKHKIIYSYIGYASQEIVINLQSDLINDVEFFTQTSNLDEIKLYAEKFYY